jgi:hypothetical protein
MTHSSDGVRNQLRSRPEPNGTALSLAARGGVVRKATASLIPDRVSVDRCSLRSGSTLNRPTRRVVLSPTVGGPGKQEGSARATTTSRTGVNRFEPSDRPRTSVSASWLPVSALNQAVIASEKFGRGADHTTLGRGICSAGKYERAQSDRRSDRAAANSTAFAQPVSVVSAGRTTEPPTRPTTRLFGAKLTAATPAVFVRP